MVYTNEDEFHIFVNGILYHPLWKWRVRMTAAWVIVIITLDSGAGRGRPTCLGDKSRT